MFLCSIFSPQVLNYITSLFFNIVDFTEICCYFLQVTQIIDPSFSSSCFYRHSIQRQLSTGFLFFKKKLVFLITHPFFQSRSKQPPNGCFSRNVHERYSCTPLQRLQSVTIWDSCCLIQFAIPMSWHEPTESNNTKAWQTSEICFSLKSKRVLFIFQNWHSAVLLWLWEMFVQKVFWKESNNWDLGTAASSATTSTFTVQLWISENFKNDEQKQEWWRLQGKLK